MKLRILSLALIIASALGCSAQELRDVKIPTESNLGVKHLDYLQFEKGFFCSAEASGAYSFRNKRKNLGFTEVDFVGGYRFSDYLRVGIGLGARRYFNSSGVRYMTHNWGLPLFLNLRGNFIPNAYRNYVPYWSVDCGTTFPDGVFIRPNVGIRIGQARSAFVASLGWLGQNIRVSKFRNVGTLKANSCFYSFINLKLGYEF